MVEAAFRNECWIVACRSVLVAVGSCGRLLWLDLEGPLVPVGACTRCCAETRAAWSSSRLCAWPQDSGAPRSAGQFALERAAERVNRHEQGDEIEKQLVRGHARRSLMPARMLAMTSAFGFADYFANGGAATNIYISNFT